MSCYFARLTRGLIAALVVFTAACLAPQAVQAHQAILLPTTSSSSSSISPLDDDDPIVSSVSLNPASIAGGASTTGIVMLSEAAPSGGTTVTLDSSSPSATVPDSVTVSEGATTATFTVATSSVSANTSATINATGDDGSSQSATLTITPAMLKSVVLSPASYTGAGNSSANRVYLHGNAAAKLNVNLTSSNTSVVSVPSYVTIEAGASSHVFPLDVNNVTSTQTVTITATYGGVSESAVLTVNPNPVALESITLSPKSATGGDMSRCTVALSTEAPQKETIALASSNPEITVPSSIVVSSGATSNDFTITAPNVTSEIQATITATFNGVSKAATLTVAPESVASVTLSPASLEGGQSSSSNTVTLASAATVTTKVYVTSSNSKVTAYGPVTIDVGSTSGTFVIYTDVVPSTETATITATCNGTKQTATLTITPPASQLQSVELTPATVQGGQTTEHNHVTFTQAVPANITVTLSSSNPAVASVPTRITVESGTTQHTLVITTTNVTSTQTAVITAQYNGVTKSATLTITPPTNPSLTQVVLNPSDLPGGTTSTQNEVVFSAPVTADTVVSLSSSYDAAQVPSSVTVPAGASSATFPITGAALTGSFDRLTITAACNGFTASADLIVDCTLKSVTPGSPSVEGGTTLTNNRVTFTGDVGTDKTVTLTSSNPSVVSVPSTVTVDYGYSSHTFTLTTQPVASAQTVTITATSGGVTQNTTVTVNP